MPLFANGTVQCTYAYMAGATNPMFSGVLKDTAGLDCANLVIGVINAAYFTN